MKHLIKSMFLVNIERLSSLSQHQSLWKPRKVPNDTHKLSVQLQILYLSQYETYSFAWIKESDLWLYEKRCHKTSCISRISLLQIGRDDLLTFSFPIPRTIWRKSWNGSELHVWSHRERNLHDVPSSECISPSLVESSRTSLGHCRKA